MGPAGAGIMGFFGAVFFIAALGPVIGWMNPLFLLPIGGFGYIAIRSNALVRRGSPAQREGTARAGKVIVWSSIGEGIGILIVVNVLANVGRADLILPGIAAVVGLHFLPMAYGIPFRAFYAVGSALLIAATLGMLLPQPTGAAVAGIAAAASLWIASAAALRRGIHR
jgi:hypothetical protein